MRSVVLLLILCVVCAYSLLYPEYQVCDLKWKNLQTPIGSICENNDHGFLISLAMGIEGTGVAPHIDSPEKLASLLSNLNNDSNSDNFILRNLYQEAFSNTLTNTASNLPVIPVHLPSLISRHIHYQGSVSLSEICSSLANRDSFYLAVVTNSNSKPEIVLADFCMEDNVVSIISPTQGRISIPTSNIHNIHAFTPSYSEKSYQALKRSPAHTAFKVSNVKKISENENSGFVLTDDPSTMVAPIEHKVWWQQCDSRWRNHLMANSTLCQVGCLQHSLTVGLLSHNAYYRIRSLETPVSIRPDTFNAFIRENQKYDKSSNLIHAVVYDLDCRFDKKTRNSIDLDQEDYAIFENLGISNISGKTNFKSESQCSASLPDDFMHKKPDLSFAQVKTLLRKGLTLAANVNNGRHFVLAVGWDSVDEDILYVRDSGSVHKHWYPFNEVVGWRIYDISGSDSPF